MSARTLRRLVLPLVVLAAASPAGAQEPAVAQRPAGDSVAKKAVNPRMEGLPLTPTRKFARAVREGSWLSVDVSPDGQTVVFDLLGDLYTVPITGGRATPLTRGMAYDAQPRFSPDGKRVVFVSDRRGGEGVWILSLDLKDTVQVTRGKDDRYMSPEWTPDGKYVVATRESTGLGRLWLYHVDGGSGISLTREPEGGPQQQPSTQQQTRAMGAAFGADGRYIWFAQRRGNWQYNSPMRDYQLAVYGRETGRAATQSFRWGGAFRPALSPDGRWLVYGTRHVSETALRIRDLRTGEERWLAHPVQRDEQESRATRDALPGFAFTPDSREVVVSYGGKIWRVPVDGSAPAEVAFEAEVDLDLGPLVEFDYPIPDSPTFVIRQIRDAVPSPDGRRIAFTALDRLYVMAYPNGTPRRIGEMEVGQFQPAWSPDGRWVVFSTWAHPEGGNLWKVSADGGRAMRLTRAPALYQQPVVSPDGKRIVAIRGPAQPFAESESPVTPGSAVDLIWISSDGGEATLIAPVEGMRRPHFTRANPDRIYAFDGGDGLVSFRWDGTDRREHLKVTGPRLPGAREPINASLIMISPDGERALAQVVNDLYVVDAIPVIGREAVTVSVSGRGEVPSRRLTEVGGQFAAWAGDSRRVHWSIGNAHFVYNLEVARQKEDSARVARRARGEVEREEPDTLREGAGAVEGAGRDRGRREERVYKPAETRVVMRATRDIPPGVAVLRGARVVTMRGNEVIENADIVIRDNRIAAVGRRESVEVPQGARVIDVAGKTIIPGFVDTHAHIWPAWGIHREQIPGYVANLAYGVTTTRDPQTSQTDVLTYGDMVTAGTILGPRIYSTGPGVFRQDLVRSKDHARDVLRRYSDYYDTKTVKMYVAGNREQRQWIIDAARELNLMVTTEGSLDAKLDLTMAIDGYSGQEHNIPAFPWYSDVTGMFAATKITYTPTTLVAYGGPWAEDYYYATESPFSDAKLRRFTTFEELQSKTLRRGGGQGGRAGWFHPSQHVFQKLGEFVRDMVRAGGRAGVGSHGQLQGLGYHWELWNIQSGGLTPHEALRVATIIGAEGIGLDRDVGSIEVGKLADLVVLERNPLENIRHTNTIRYVMMNGRLYEGDSLDEVWPRVRKAGPFYWQKEDAAEPRTAAGIGKAAVRQAKQ